MTCPNCGAELAAGQKFCNKCGFNVEAAQTQGSGNDQHVTQPTDNQNNGGSANGPANGTSGDQLDQMNNGQNNAQPTGNNGQGAGFNLNNGNNGPQAGFQPANGNNNQNAGFDSNSVNNSQNAGFNPNNGNNNQNAGFNPNGNNNQNAGFNPNNGNNNQNAGFNPNMANNGQAGYQQNGGYNGQNPGFQQNMGNNGQQFNGQQGFNNQGQFQNGQGNYQQQPNAISYMMPFLKNNSALAICLAVIILLVAFFNWKVAAVILVIALIAWYFLADKNHDQSLPLNNSIGSFFSNVGNTSAGVETEQTNKIKLVVAIASIASLLFLFVGNFIGTTFDLSAISDEDARSFIQALGITGSSFTFNGTITLLKKIVTATITAGSALSSVTVDDSALEGAKTISTLLTAVRWIVIALPIVTVIFTFVKTKASSIIRIISSALSSILLASLAFGLMALNDADDQDLRILSQFINLGYSYYITLIASLVAFAFAIRWLVVDYKNNSAIRAQQMGNYNMQQNNFGNPNQGNFNGNQNIPNNPAGFNNGQNSGNVSGDQSGVDGSGN